MLVPYDAKTLAKITNTNMDTVRVAMDILTKIGLIQILENGEIFITQLQNMVGSETKWAEKKRLQRQKKDNVPRLSGQCPIEKEIEKEIEIEQDTDKDNVVVNCFKYAQKVGVLLTPYHYQELVSYIEDGVDDNLIIRAIDIAVGSGNRNFNYIKGIINNWLSSNIKTLLEAEDHQRKFKKSKSIGEKDGKYQDYAKHLDSKVEGGLSTEETIRAAAELGIEL